LYLADGVEGHDLRRDLRGVPRRVESWGDLVRLATVEVYPQHGRAFRFGEPLRIRIEIEAIVSRSHAAVGVGVDDVTGARIATFNSADHNVALTLARGERRSFELCIPDPRLKPGAYGLSCAVVSGEQLLDFVSPAVALEIGSVDAQTGEPVLVGEGSGPIVLPGTWSVSESAFEATSAGAA
jgi:hypothetical protein